MRIDVHVPYEAKFKRVDVRSLMQAGTVKAVVPALVREVAASEAPISARFESPEGMVTVRSIEGRSAVRTNRPPEFRNDAAWLADACARTHSYDRSLRLGRSELSFVATPTENDPRIVVKQVPGARDAAVARTMAAVAELTLVDGELWRASTDPILTVVLAGGVGRETATVAARVPKSTETRFLDSFRLDQADLVGPYLASVLPGRRPEFALPYVDLVEAEALDFSPQLAALRWAGQVVASYVKPLLAHAPLETMRRYARVRDLAAGRPDPSPGAAAPGGDALREAVAEAYEAISPHETMHGQVTRAIAGWDVLVAHGATLEREEDLATDLAP